MLLLELPVGITAAVRAINTEFPSMRFVLLMVLLILPTGHYTNNQDP